MDRRLKIAIVGTGIAGLSAAWLLSRRHDVTVYERADRLGGHSNTVYASLDGHVIPVDTGFIVFNRRAYPNLVALFDHLGVATMASDMSFAVSMDGGAMEYSGTGLSGIFGQPANLARPQFWSMLSDLVRFYRAAPRDLTRVAESKLSLGDYLEEGGYRDCFRDHHILPMAGAIWSAAPAEIGDYPAAAFIRFYENHGLFKLRRRPKWETVVGGSRTYVERLCRPFADRIRLDTAVMHVRRSERGAIVTDAKGNSERFDHVVMAMHADQTLAVLADAGEEEHATLGSFRYNRNHAVLHTDSGLMPLRRRVWSSWNYMGVSAPTNGGISVTYWMNRLQPLPIDKPVFVTLNPTWPPRPGTLLHSEVYDHPIMNSQAHAAQRRLWHLQGRRNTWFCGAYFGAGFHEDGLQAGLAVAEQLGAVRRPWTVANESARIQISQPATDYHRRELVE